MYKGFFIRLTAYVLIG